MFWGFLSYFMFPMACACLFLMLSGIGFLERFGHKIVCANIDLGGIIRCNVMFFFVCLACLGFVVSSMDIDKLSRLRDDGVEHVSLDDRYKLQLFRDQRNWWIALSNFVLWLTCWRLAALINKKIYGANGANGGPGSSSKMASDEKKLLNEPKKEK